MFLKKYKSKNIKLDEFLLYLFLLCYPFSIRKIILFYPIRGVFNEYTGIYIYLADLVVAMIIILYNKNIIKSIYTAAVICIKKYNDFKNVPRGTFLKMKINDIGNIKNAELENVPRGTFFVIEKVSFFIYNYYVLVFPLFLVLFSFISIVWSENKYIALFRSIKLFFIIFAFYFVIYIFKKRTELKYSTWNIFKKMLLISIFIGFLNSFLAILQFIFQKSLRFYFFGESIFSINMAGVAKIFLNDNIFIRSYGFFPHPNILGGYLLFSIVASFVFYKMFHVEHFIVKYRIVFYLILIIQFLGLFFSFSKSAFIGLFIAFFYIGVNKCSTWNIYNIILDNKKSAIGVIFFFIFFIFFIFSNADKNILKSFNERNNIENVPRGTFLNKNVKGIGAGQSIVFMVKYYNLENWKYQPVHNVFKIIYTEMGVFLFLGFIFFLFRLLEYQKNEFIVYFRGCLVGFIFIMFFDHYFWDIHQGQIMLWILFSFIIITEKYLNKGKI